MKKTIILALAALTLNVTSQSSIQLRYVEANNGVIIPGSVIYDLITVAEGNVKINFDITNTSTTTLQYKAKRYDVLLNPQAVAYFCFAGECYASVTLVSDPLTLNGGQSASAIGGENNVLTADLDEFSTTTGPSLVKYTFFNTANVNDSVQVSIAYNKANPVGIKENRKSSISFDVFPNPVKDIATINIQAAKSFESDLILVNSLGSIVYQKHISVVEGKNKIDLDLENLPSGIYFVSTKTGETTLSKKLIIN